MTRSILFILFAMCISSCTTTELSDRSWVERVTVALKSAERKYNEVDQADPTLLIKVPVKF